MEIDQELLNQFEAGLNLQDLAKSSIPVKVVGYGEISAIFQINNDPGLVYKRMPLFKTREDAENYRIIYREYCNRLKEAGLALPQDATAIVALENHPVALYIAQESFDAGAFCHNQIHELDNDDAKQLMNAVAQQIQKVWAYNREAEPSVELALDGQLSNWVLATRGNEEKLYYVDTSTPLFRKNGVEQMDPELMLQSAPGFLRWIIRLFFLSDVMNRYYDLKLVYTDLAANLFKEQRKDLIPAAIETMNQSLLNAEDRITFKQVQGYYREDKLIWILFLFFRKIDRFLKTRILGQPYDFILPGKIKR